MVFRLAAKRNEPSKIVVAMEMVAKRLRRGMYGINSLVGGHQRKLDVFKKDEEQEERRRE